MQTLASTPAYPQDAWGIVNDSRMAERFRRFAKGTACASKVAFLEAVADGMAVRALYNTYLMWGAHHQVAVSHEIYCIAEALADRGDWSSHLWPGLVAAVRDEVAGEADRTLTPRFWASAASEPFRMAYH